MRRLGRGGHGFGKKLVMGRREKLKQPGNVLGWQQAQVEETLPALSTIPCLHSALYPACSQHCALPVLGITPCLHPALYPAFSRHHTLPAPSITPCLHRSFLALSVVPRGWRGNTLWGSVWRGRKSSCSVPPSAAPQQLRAAAGSREMPSVAKRMPKSWRTSLAPMCR